MAAAVSALSDPLRVLIEQPVWMKDAACKGQPVGVFFPLKAHSPPPTTRELCAGCPVGDQCLVYAVTVNEQHGVWGGLLPKERRRVRRLWVRRREIYRDGRLIWPA